MAKPEPTLLDPARYRFQTRLEPRFGDIDINLHINNVAMASMLEEAHVRFHRASGYVAGRDPGLRSMVASVAIEYLAQGAYPGAVDIHVALERVGQTSHTLVQLAIQDDRVLAFSRTVIVTMSRDGPAVLPGSFVVNADNWKLLP